MRALLRSMRPDNFEDISAVGALYRPGPMGANSHNEYADRKNGRKQVKPIHPELAEPLADILDDTYGLIVYQEQVIAIAQKVAGYSIGAADLLRRAMGKKKKAELDAQFETFSSGMRDRGYSADAVRTLWEILVPFSDYAFNKAHSAAYGVISYWTAYLKANYPAEYMAALLTSMKDDKDALGDLPGRMPAHGHQRPTARRKLLGGGLHADRQGHPLRARRGAQCRRQRRRIDRGFAQGEGRVRRLRRLPAQGRRRRLQQAHRRGTDQGRRVRLARPHPAGSDPHPRTSVGHRRRNQEGRGDRAIRPVRGRLGRGQRCRCLRRRGAGRRVGQERPARLRTRDAGPLRLRPSAARPRARAGGLGGAVDSRAARRRRSRGTSRHRRWHPVLGEPPGHQGGGAVGTGGARRPRRVDRAAVLPGHLRAVWHQHRRRRRGGRQRARRCPRRHGQADRQRPDPPGPGGRSTRSGRGLGAAEPVHAADGGTAARGAGRASRHHRGAPASSSTASGGTGSSSATATGSPRRPP